jgi:transcriptional regulator with XRE-family HTH domain
MRRMNTSKMKARRMKLKLTQQEVGYLARVSASDVSRIENNRMIPYPTQAKKIARILKLDPAELQRPGRVARGDI